MLTKRQHSNKPKHYIFKDSPIRSNIGSEMPPSRKLDKALGSILTAASSSLPVKLFYYTKANSGFVTCALKIVLDTGDTSFR